MAPLYSDLREWLQSHTELNRSRARAPDRQWMWSAANLFVAAVAGLLVLWQVNLARRASDVAMVTTISAAWNAHLSQFLTEEEMIPYFFEGTDLAADDPMMPKVGVMADIRLEAIDRILIATRLEQWTPAELEGWRVVFASAFASSPFLQRRYCENISHYDQIKESFPEGCKPPSTTQ